MSKHNETTQVETRGHDGVMEIRLSGRLDHHAAAAVLSQASAALARGGYSRVSIDLSGVEYMDSAGALAVRQIGVLADRISKPVSMDNVTPEYSAVLDLIDLEDVERPPLLGEREYRNTISRLGAASVGVARDLVDTVSFAGRIIAATVHSLVHPHSVRWNEVRANIQLIGVDGLPLTGILSFLMGFIVASMAVSQLRAISMSNLIGGIVGVAIMQEFGPLIAALISAGRTGSAIASEIATMSVNEEVNAITAMGYEPLRFLAVPKLLAAVVAVPLMTLYCDVLGILGGLIIARSQLGLGTYGYFVVIPQSVSLFSFAVAMVKTFIFGFIIATIGCQRGFRTHGGAEEVGKSTTSAVVTGIFLIILTDFVFASLVPYLG
jgi:phospholipid/cholesterol/gamma-HCH transport system permease protein